MNDETTTVLAQEGTHFYTRTGVPVYTVPRADGKGERDATLRDARKLQLVPGQTAIIGCSMKWALVDWMVDQGIMAALTLPPRPTESESEFLARIKADSKAQAKQAASTGTAIHAAFERDAKDEPYDQKWMAHVEKMAEAITAVCGWQDWQAEKSYAHPSGYGCKLDLISPSVLVDHKGKDGPLAGLKTWPEHWMQLAAGRRAARIPTARCFINYFRRDQPEALCVEVSEEELSHGLGMFDGLLAYWKAKNRYESGWTE